MILLIILWDEVYNSSHFTDKETGRGKFSNFQSFPASEGQCQDLNTGVLPPESRLFTTAILHLTKNNSNYILKLYHEPGCSKCFHLLIHQIQQPHEVSTIIPIYRWRNGGTGRVTNLPKLVFKPTAWLQSPHHYCYAAPAHQAAAASLNDGGAFRKERERSSKGRVLCKLSSVYAQIPSCPLPFSCLLPHLISSPNHSTFSFLPLILQPVSLHLFLSFFNSFFSN